MSVHGDENERPSNEMPIANRGIAPERLYDDARLKAALYCGVVTPLFAGLGVVLFSLTKSAVIVRLGFPFIAIGLFFVASGTLLLLLHVICNWSFIRRGETRIRRRIELLATAFVLLSNCPICFVILGYMVDSHPMAGH